MLVNAVGIMFYWIFVFAFYAALYMCIVVTIRDYIVRPFIRWKSTKNW